MAKNGRGRIDRKRQETERNLLTAVNKGFQLEARVAELETLAQAASNAAMSARILLEGLLTQAGGVLEVTKGTLEQCHENYQNLGWTVTQKKGDENTYVVTLQERKPEEKS